MTIDLQDLRIRIDQVTEKIISGLKDRSRYMLNTGVFTEEFSDGMTWFEYMLKGDQSLHSEFGRFDYPDQYPIMFTKDELTQPKKKRVIPECDVKAVSIDMCPNIIEFYKSILPELCKQGENENNYGATVECDVKNVKLYSERINGVGRYVAESKVQKDPSILELKTDDEIRKSLVYPKRERQVIRKAVRTARRYELCEPTSVVKLFKKMCGTYNEKARYVKPEFIQKFFRGIIDMMVDAEVQYIKRVR